MIVAGCAADHPTTADARDVSLSIVTTPPCGDSSPNQWQPRGDGASQSARLVDDDDATFICAGVRGGVSCFALDCASLPKNTSLIRSITLVTRESLAQCCEQLRCYEVYVDDELYWFVLVPRVSAPEFAEYTTRIAGPESGFPPIRISSATRVEIGFNGTGLQSGERWAVSRLRVDLGCPTARNSADPRELESPASTAFYH